MSLLFRSAAPTETRAFGATAEQLLAAAANMRAPGSVPPRYDVGDALRVAAVVACVGLRAGAFAQLPLKGYRYNAEGLATLLDPQPELLRSPSDVVVPSVWKTQMSISRDLWGFALGRVVAWDGAMYPKRVEWIDPQCVTYEVHHGLIEWRIDGEFVDASLLFHVPSRFVLPGNPVGMSPLERSGLVDLAKRAQDFGRDWFKFGAVPSAILKSDKELTTAQADTILERIMQRWRSRQPAVIGTGMEYQQISVAANESQFLETVRQASADIAVSFNMPPEKVAAAISGQAVTYANREQNQQQYLVDSINPDLVVIQESMDRYSRPSEFSRFATGALLRTDLKTRMEAYKLAAEVQNLSGAIIYTEDEMRMLEEREPLPPREQVPAKPWQAVGLPALVDGGIINVNEAREELGKGPVPGGNVLRDPMAEQAPAEGGAPV